MLDFERIPSQYSYKFKIMDMPSIGVALSEAENNKVKVLQRGFLLEHDSNIFSTALSEFQKLYLNHFFNEMNIDMSGIGNFVIQISPDNEVHVEINTPLKGSILAKGPSKQKIKKGDPVTKNQIADIKELEMPYIEIKENWGKIVFFSVNSKRGLYLDLTPLDVNSDFFSYPLEKPLAQLYTYLTFPELIETFPKIQKKLIKRGWFPFIHLLGTDFERLSSAIEKKLKIDEIEKEIIDSFDDEYILSLVDEWMKNPLFQTHKSHEDIIRRGIDRYLNNDYISAIHILIPRIEGLLRYLYAETSSKNASFSDLREMLKNIGSKKDSNLILPFDFDEYLKSFYFKGFTVYNKDVKVSRMSIAHGVAIDYSKKSAFQAIMILDQLSYYI